MRADYRSVCHRDDSWGMDRSRGRRLERRSRYAGPSDRTGPESSGRGRLEPVALGDASSERAARGVSVVSRDDASPAAVHDLLTDAQLAARWQLSRGTLANQRSQGRGSAYLKLAGRIRYRLSDIEAYEQAGFVSREPAGTTSPGDPSDVRETVARLISISRFLIPRASPGFSSAPGSQDPCQVALITLEVAAEVHASSNAHIGVA